MDNIYNYQCHYYKKSQYRIKDIMIPKKRYEKRNNNFQIRRNKIENRRFGKEIKDINNLTEIQNVSNCTVTQIGEIISKIKKENGKFNYKDNFNLNYNNLNYNNPSIKNLINKSNISNLVKDNVNTKKQTFNSITESNNYINSSRHSSITTKHNYKSFISNKNNYNTLNTLSSNSRSNQRLYQNSVVIKNIRKNSQLKADNSISNIYIGSHNSYNNIVKKINNNNNNKEKGKENDNNTVNIINNNYFNYNNRSKYKKRTINNENIDFLNNHILSNSIKNINRETHIMRFIRKQYNLPTENESNKILNLSLNYRKKPTSKDIQNIIFPRKTNLAIPKLKDNKSLIPINKNSLLERYNINYILMCPRNTNPQIPQEYINDIYKHLKSIEYDNLPLKNYMEIIQNDINENMRLILIDWLVEVHIRYKLLTETLFITINLIDRFLSIKNINRKFLQLLGITSLLIACKYEEIYPPEIKDLIHMTDDAYNRKQVFKMEYEILNALNFNISFPTSLKFLEYFKTKLNLKEKTFYRCLYFIEASLIDYKSSCLNPSLIAATSLFYNIMNKDKIKEIEYDENNIVNITGYNRKNIIDSFYCLNNSIKNLENIDNKYNAIRRKFKLDKYMNVSNINYFIELKGDIEKMNQS